LEVKARRHDIESEDIIKLFGAKFEISVKVNDGITFSCKGRGRRGKIICKRNVQFRDIESITSR